MDLRFTAEENEFRQEVRAFLRANVPEDVRRWAVQGQLIKRDELIAWTRILNRKGWAAPHWPTRYGGTGWDPMKQYIFLEELQTYPAPQPVASGINLVGPVIYTFGNEDQKRRFLPAILNADHWWAQGFSEPEAGSDLAALKTRAIRDRDHYVVNGQKSWTSYAHYSNWIFCLVRTDSSGKKQAGISFLLIDMQTPGVDVRPVQTIDGGHEINEVFLTDVRVPVANLVGEENRGWDYAKFLLGAERTNIAGIGFSRQRLSRIRELAATETRHGRPLIDDPRFREQLASVEIELKALEVTQLRVVAADARRGNGGGPDPASSVLKIKGSEIQQQLSHLLMQVLGPFAAQDPHSLDEGSNAWQIGPASAAEAAPGYFNLRKASIYGGSNEIQKNIIAKAVLGL